MAEPDLRWQDNWRRVGTTEYVLTGGLTAGILTVMLWVPPAEEPAWRRPRLMDWGTRNWLRIEDRAGRDRAATVSDVLVTASVLQPVVVDSLIVAGLVEGSGDVTHQMEVINLQSLAIAQFVNVTAKRVFARERPYVLGCAGEKDYSAHCDDVDRFRSYYSGHSAISATAAGLVCAHHTHLPLYGRPADGIACGAAIGVTVITGALRIAADRHWATDVLSGHLLGFAAGYLLPTLAYYRSFRRQPEVPQTTGQQPLRRSAPALVAFSGRF